MHFNVKTGYVLPASLADPETDYARKPTYYGRVAGRVPTPHSAMKTTNVVIEPFVCVGIALRAPSHKLILKS